MPVIPTDHPNIVKLSFISEENLTNQTETIVYARALFNGTVELHYSHQTIRERPYDSGPWDKHVTTHKSPLNRSQMAWIRSKAIMTLIDERFTDLQLINLDVDADPTVFLWPRG